MWHLKIASSYFMHFDVWNSSWGTTDEKKYYIKKIQGAYCFIKYLPAIQFQWIYSATVNLCAGAYQKLLNTNLCLGCKLFNRWI